MTEYVTIEVVGNPQGKGRARAVVRKDKAGRTFAGTYTPEKTRTYEGLIRSASLDAMKGKQRFDCPVRLELTAIFDVPASYSRKKSADALANHLKPAKKPDLDNVIKAFCDGMNGVIYKDDAQIVRWECWKVYGPEAKVIATVSAA